MASDSYVAERRELLKGYCEHVPPSVNNGSHTMSVKFKADVAKANKVRNSGRATLQEIESAINLLHSYWL